jgi:TfoX/Sxy family transcriptional regulator of competence genes
MAYDEELARRVRELLRDVPAVTEKRMFGGLGFLVGDHMAVAASGQGGLLVRVDPAEGETLVATTGAQPMEMRGRQMSGWLRVEAVELATADALSSWVTRGVAYARSLPPKRGA